MANDVTLFRDTKDLVPGTAGLDDITKRLLGGSNYKRISIKGGKFRMIVNGQEAARCPTPHMDVVVVNAAPHVSRTFYAKTFDPSAVGLPDCWSNDGIRPDPKASSPQGKSCETCPQNIAGSGANGKRACRFSRRLAVVLANDVMNSDVYQLQLPATSIFGKAQNGNMPLDAYVKQLAGFNHSITGVVTELRFDENAEAPKLFFRAVRPLDAAEMSTVREKSQSEEATAAITFNPAQMDTAKQATAPTAEPAQEAPLFRESPKAPSEPTVRAAKQTPQPTVTEKTPEQILDEWANETDD
jgi:hypothetical protein